MTINQKRKIFSKLENKKIKIYCLGGGRKISIKRPYSLKRDKKRKIIRIYCGRDKISSFGEDVAVATIERCILDHKSSSQREQKEKERIKKTWWLKEYCETNWSSCKTANFDCNKCESSHKKWALERKKKGKKIVKPVKTGGLKEFFEERDTLKEKAGSENKKISYKQPFTRAWK